MYPRLFELGPFSIFSYEAGPFAIYSYGVLLAAAYLVALRYSMMRGRQRGLDEARILDLGIYIIISAVVGAKLLLLLVDFDHFRQNPSDILSLARSGGVFYGGLILAAIVGFWYANMHSLPIWTTCDAIAPGIALGHVVGRMGCLLAGCCYGRPTDVPWAITFHDSFAAANVGTPLDVPLHPTQLYDAGAELFILILLLATERKGRPFAGRTFWAYILMYGISRFIIEFYRGDPRGIMPFGGLSTSQFISLLLVPLSVVMLIRLARRGAPSPADSKLGRARAA